MVISNLTPLLDGDRYLVIKRRYDPQAPQWGSGVSLPEWTTKWLKVSFAFRQAGPAMAHVGTFELFGRSGPHYRLYAVDLSRRTSRGELVTLENEADHSSVNLGKIKSGCWYRVQLLIPGPSRKG